MSLKSLYIPLYNYTPFAMIMDSWNVQDILIRGEVKSEMLQNALLLSPVQCSCVWRVNFV